MNKNEVINMRNFMKTVAVGIVWLVSSAVMATPIACQNTNVNHMIADSSQVVSCMASGSGNINGNPNGGNADPFLTGVGSGYSLASKDDAANPFNIVTTQNGSSGTWSIDASFWLTNVEAALGFKFGTGNNADSWFVFELVSGMSSGSWNFVNVFGPGGGLSHTNLYSTNELPPPVTVSEPGLVLLFGFGVLALAVARRRIR